ncbi:CCGSCS motif protein [Halomonas kashgarensis]|uniref:CCGSCS motif protein n=1 Tax=Halomonas kashgarensis TaxID=3084920 RepID=UPI003A920624
MGLLKSLFQKKDAIDKPVVQTQEPVSVKPDRSEPAANAVNKKAKHGEEGVCCGSCQ